MFYKFLVIVFPIINFVWPFFMGWFILGFIGGILGVCLDIYDGSEFWLGPLALIGAIYYLIESRRKTKKE